MGSQTRGGTVDRGREAGGVLLHPVALVALGLLIVNDHVLKAAFPGVVTGKLSDVAGLVFFPLLLLAAWELVRAAGRRPRGAGPGTVAVGVGVTAVVFTLVKVVPAAADAFGWGLGAAQWAIGLPGAVLLGHGVPGIAAAQVIADPTDLLALPALLLAAWIALPQSPRRTRTA